MMVLRFHLELDGTASAMGIQKGLELPTRIEALQGKRISDIRLVRTIT